MSDTDIPEVTGFGDSLLILLSRLGPRVMHKLLIVPVLLFVWAPIAAFHAALPSEFKLLTMFLLVALAFCVMGMSFRLTRIEFHLDAGSTSPAGWVERLLWPARIVFWGWIAASHAWFFQVLDGELPV